MRAPSIFCAFWVSTADPAGFRIDLHHKDMGIVAGAARAAGVVTPVGALVAQLVAATRAAGDGGLDHSALHRTIGNLSGG